MWSCFCLLLPITFGMLLSKSDCHKMQIVQGLATKRGNVLADAVAGRMASSSKQRNTTSKSKSRRHVQHHACFRLQSPIVEARRGAVMVLARSL